MKFEWGSYKAALNKQRHKVTFTEATEAFFDPNGVDDFDFEHSDEEARYNLIGLSSRRLLFVVYTETDNAVRIISARKAEKKHRRIYEHGR
ncbi:MAG: BrnT family toxin [Ardenticatenaceae bacterium]